MAKLKKLSEAPGINLPTITMFIEQYVADNYPIDIDEFEFIEREMNGLIQIHKWTDFGMLGFSIDNIEYKKFTIYAVELLAYKLTEKGKNEKNINLNNMPFVVCVCTDITNGMPTNANIVYIRPFNEKVSNIIGDLKNDVQEIKLDAEPSSLLNGIICLTNEAEPSVLKTKINELFK